MSRPWIALLGAAALVACSEKPTTTGPPIDTREPIRIAYVGAPELQVHKAADQAAAVIGTYQNGEAVSVLAEKGEWAEIRTGGSSGWVNLADLTDAAGKQAQENDPQARFRVMPLPVSAPSARGEIYIEADVNSDGDVVTVRTLTNTTGSAALAFQNEESLRAAKFHPMVQKGARMPFKYYHKVTY